MENIIAVSVDGNIHPYEIEVVTEAGPDFLPKATIAQAEGQRAILYSSEGLTPLAAYGVGTGSGPLGLIFMLLTGYIRCLLAARDMLLDTRLISSDPERGVFAERKSEKFVAVKAVWGIDELADDNQKICRIAHALAGRERVMGAKMSMDRTIELVRSENTSLSVCLKVVENVCREWNHIVE